jgi:hypothetical protein
MRHIEDEWVGKEKYDQLMMNEWMNSESFDWDEWESFVMLWDCPLANLLIDVSLIWFELDETNKQLTSKQMTMRWIVDWFVCWINWL